MARSPGVIPMNHLMMRRIMALIGGDSSHEPLFCEGQCEIKQEMAAYDVIAVLIGG